MSAIFRASPGRLQSSDLIGKAGLSIASDFFNITVGTLSVDTLEAPPTFNAVTLTHSVTVVLELESAIADNEIQELTSAIADQVLEAVSTVTIPEAITIEATSAIIKTLN